MGDPHLESLVRGHTALPFPSGVRGEDVDGVDLMMLDADLNGVAWHYVRNSRSLTPEHARMLGHLIADVDRIMPLLPTADARDYYASVRAIAAHLLATRDIPAR